MTAGGAPGKSGSPLGDRYNVVRELGRGGFGQTYLAEDLHRYKELCVVKEFVPQVEDSATLEKAKELFEREANVLYQLGHKQIPEFRQLLEVQSDTGGRLFIVQDYVEGPTYQKLLEGRKRFNGQFSETEITQLLYQLLPVLSYIHSMDLVHRDISPDNLILRQEDGLPVLIDFGSVKEIAAAVRSQLSIEGVGPKSTRIGKVGFVPQEQLATGDTDPTSDLYGLAATLMVLTTGEDASMLYDPYDASWKGFEGLSPKLAKILAKMLAAEPAQRYPSAEAVLAALNSEDGAMRAEAVPVAGDALYPPVGMAAAGATAATDYEMGAAVPEGSVVGGGPAVSQVYAAQTDYQASETELAMSEAAAASDVYEPAPPMDADSRATSRENSMQALLGLLALLGTVFLALALLSQLWPRNRATVSDSGGDERSALKTEVVEMNGEKLYQEEALRRQQIRDRREALGISNNYFTRLVDQLFYAEYPNLRTSGPNGGPKPLTGKPEDEPLRIRWDNIASDVLDLFDGNFSQGGLTSLGNYSENNRADWKSKVNQANVSSSALFDLVDAKFLRLFPSQGGQNFLTQPAGQLYYALADDKANAIANGGITQNISISDGAYSQDVSGQLAPGDGRIYTVQVTAGQILRLNLSAPAESTLFSLYLPSSQQEALPVFDDSEQTTWSGNVEQSGYYQVVVVNRANEKINYGLTVSVDNISEPPVAPPVEEEAAAENEAAEGSAETTEDTADTSAGDTENTDAENPNTETTDTEASGAGDTETDATEPE